MLSDHIHVQSVGRQCYLTIYIPYIFLIFHLTLYCFQHYQNYYFSLDVVKTQKQNITSFKTPVLDNNSYHSVISQNISNSHTLNLFISSHNGTIKCTCKGWLVSLVLAHCTANQRFSHLIPTAGRKYTWDYVGQLFFILFHKGTSLLLQCCFPCFACVKVT